MKHTTLMIVLVFSIPFIPSLQSQEEEKNIQEKLDAVFADLDRLEEEERATARENWDKMSIVERARILLASRGPQQALRSIEVTEWKAIEVLEEARIRLSAGKYLFIAENRSRLTKNQRIEFDKKRRELVSKIVSLGDASIPGLLSRLDDGPEHSALALEAWVKMGEQAYRRLLALLDESLESGDDELSKNIMGHIRQYRKRSSAGVVIPIAAKHLEKALLEDQVPDTLIKHYIWTISFTRSRESVPLLIRALECDRYVDKRGRPTQHPRHVATKELGLIGDERAMDALVEAIKNGDGYLRLCAVVALGSCGTESAIGLLEEIERFDPLKDKGGNHYIRKRAREAIEKIRERAESK